MTGDLFAADAAALEDVDVVVAGSGLLGVTVAAALAQRVGSECVAVVDRSPLLAECAEWIDRLEVALIGGDSALADALRVVTRSSHLARGGVPLDARAALDRCRRGVQELGLDHSWRPARLSWLVPVDGGRRTLVQLADGSQLRARRVVLAPGAQHRVLPHWVDDLSPQPTDRLIHGDDLDLRGMDLAGEDIAVVGAADLSLHLALSALRHGAERVEIITSETVELLGSVSADELFGGTLCVRERSRVIAASACDRQFELMLGNEDRSDVDRVWLATGTGVDLLSDRSLRFVREFLPAGSSSPAVLDDELRWPGSTIHVVGPAAVRRGASGRPLRVARTDATQLVVVSISASLRDSPSRAR